MAIKHLEGRDLSEIFTPDVPIWKRREVLYSPLVILVGLGFICFGLYHAIIWILKWPLFSCIRPFTNSKWFCKQGLHKYRYISGTTYKIYICKICQKEKTIYVDDGGY